jgi:hypothetical protein
MTVIRVGATTEKKKAEKTEARLGESLKKKWESKSTLGSNIIIYYYYRYSALGPVRAETRAQSGDRYGFGMMHSGQILRGSLPLLSPYIHYNT